MLPPLVAAVAARARHFCGDMQAFNEVGGVDWLVGLAKSDPRTFAMLLAKLIPHEAARLIGLRRRS